MAALATEGSKSSVSLSKTQSPESKVESTRIPVTQICTHEAPINSIAWIAFQFLTALNDARNRQLSHGDTKSQNIIVIVELALSGRLRLLQAHLFAAR